MDPLVSIVMPAYNAERYIEEAVSSVLKQTYSNWQLIIINDGSTDETLRRARSFTDARIQVYSKPNGGIGSARNAGLEHVRGSLLAFLDADDVLPPDSILGRVRTLQAHPEVDATDGRMLVMDRRLEHIVRVYEPRFQGQPFKELIRLTGTCFGGITWMVRWPVEPTLRFDEDAHQMEDLLFWISYSQPGRSYMPSDTDVLIYRRTGHGITSNLQDHEQAYRYLHRQLIRRRWATRGDLRRFRWRCRRVMLASWLHARRPLRALVSVLMPFR